MSHDDLIDSIRAEVARRHNVLLGRDDPIFVTVTVNELVLAHYVDLVATRAEAATDRGVAASAAQVQASKETAGKLISEASGFVADQVRRAARSAADDFSEAIKQRLGSADREARDAHAARSGAMWAAVTAGAFAVIAIACTVIVLIKG